MATLFSNEDRSQIRREITVAILGVIIGALTTFVNKFIESEYLFQRNLKVIEYDDDCKAVSDKELTCVVNIRASGLREIKKTRVTLVAPDTVQATITTDSMLMAPSFAPPDPTPQFEGSGVDTGFLALSVPRFRDPQRLSWKVTIVASAPLKADDVQRVVSCDDPDARIEEGGSWRWKRWVPIGMLGLIVPLAIALILLVLVWLFRPPREKKGILWE